MASTAAPLAVNGGTSASMWASQPAPPRSGWAGKSSESSPALRAKGSSRGRGGRGGGRGSRSTNTRNGTTKPEPAVHKHTTGVDQPQEKSSSDPPKHSAQLSSAPPLNQIPSNASSRQSHRPRPARRGSETKGSRKGPTLTVDPAATSTSNTSSSPSVSPHTPSRRKRGNSKATVPPPAPAVPVVPRKQPVSQEATAPKEKPLPAKDIPPHLAPPPPPPPSAHFDIKHDIDALVERVRAVAMDRPHTPGSHIDWAGEDDDSLPDLDDWGVPSTATSTSHLQPEPPKATADIISPILQDTLKPLPMIDIDIPTPSIKLHEVDTGAAAPADGGDETPRDTHAKGFNSISARTSSGPSSTATHSNRTSTKPSSAPSPLKTSTTLPPKACVDVSDPEQPSIQAEESSSVHPGDAASNDSSSPKQGLASSMHAMSSSTSMPTTYSSRPPRAGFQPSHTRAHTVGRFKPEHRPGADQPHREISHGRNHSTPSTGPGTGRGRGAHATRPVISVDAISRIARQLGGAAPARKPKEATPAPAESA